MQTLYYPNEMRGLFFFYLKNLLGLSDFFPWNYTLLNPSCDIKDHKRLIARTRFLIEKLNFPQLVKKFFVKKRYGIGSVRR
jgi:hypothetical protein